jgi:hypothetical protein
MHKILLLLLLPLVRLPKLIMFNPHLPERIKIKRKGRVRTRRTRIIIHNMINPKQKPLMRKINLNLVTPALFVVIIITRKIVRDVLRLLSSSKGPENLLHLLFCHNLSLLSSEPNWSFMTKLLLLPHLMSLCVLVILKRTKLQSQLEPKINLHPKRKLMIYHLRWFNLLPQLHLPMVLFISNDRVSTQFFRPPPKGIVRKCAFNPHARAAQKYSIVEDLAQAPSAMSTLDVLQIFPSQRKALLNSIGGIDPTYTNLIIFDLEDHVPRLPPQLAFQIQVVVENKNICRTVIDEGSSTCVMFVSDISCPRHKSIQVCKLHEKRPSAAWKNLVLRLPIK